MAADVEPVSLVLVGPADPADERGLGLQDDARAAVPGQLVGGGEPGRPGAGDDRGVRGDDGDLGRVVDPGPAVGRQAGSDAFRSRNRRIGAHPGPPWLGGCLSGRSARSAGSLALRVRIYP